MALNRVWTGLDALVQVYWNDANGNRINANGGPWIVADGPLVPYCYFQNMTLDGNVPNVRRPVTGRPYKKIVVEIDEWELSVEHFYLGLTKELSPNVIFARDKILELVISLIAPESTIDSEPHTLKPGRRVACSVGGAENEVWVGTAKFVAEQFL